MRIGDNSINITKDNIDLKKQVIHMCENTDSKGSLSESNSTKEKKFIDLLGDKSEISEAFKENIKILKNVDNAKNL